jgi:hypothetical protein
MVQELKKITINTSVEPPTPVVKVKKRFPWKFILIPLGIIVIIIVVIGIMLLPLRGVMAKAKDLAVSGSVTMEAVKAQDLEKVKAGLADTRGKLTELETEYKKVLPLKAIPFLGAYIADGDHTIKAAFAGVTAGDKALEAIEPNADLLGLKGTKKSTFLEGTAEDRLQFAVKTMSALIPKINEMATSVDTLRKELGAIDPNRYPEKIGKTVIRSKMVSAFSVIDEMANLFVNAQPLLVNLPALLGEPEEKRYLVLFQNDKELRSTGGFITAYAQFRMAKGKPILEKADDIYALDATITKKFAAPREILTFHKGVYNLNIRDSNLSPDYKQSMQQFEEMYKYASGKEKIDGIIAVDTHVLVEALKILGPIYVYDREFSAVIDKRCDCPKAVYELEDYSTRPVNYVRTARKDIIGVLLQQILRMALGVSPSKYWGSLFQMLIAEINEKHVLAYFHDDATQKAAESFNLAGRIMTASESAAILKYKENDGWDYLHVNNSNMAGAKSNMFVTSEVTKDATVNSDGTITTKLTIDYKNPYPGSDCGLESGGLCLNAPLRNWIRVYTPAGSKLGDNKGSISPKDGKPISLETYESLGKTVFEGFLIVNPMGTAKLEMTYTSPVKTQGAYKLLIQKQPGTSDEEYAVKLNGKERKRSPLVTDTEYIF